MSGIIAGIRTYEDRKSHKLTADQFATATTHIYQFAKTEARSKDPAALTDALALYLTAVFNRVEA